MADTPTPQHDSGQQTVVVAAECWACDTVLHRHIERRGPGHLTWACEACGVSWFGPGQPVEAA